MATLSTETIGALLAPYLPEPEQELLEKLSVYLDLLLKWNERTNLTAIREPEHIVTQHFGECLFAARHLPAVQSILDLGSGAGFPGIPVQLMHPELAVTLSESQNKKAAFLREVVQRLELKSHVWSARVESMPAEKVFDAVAWRAVDRASVALDSAVMRVAPSGWLICLRSGLGPLGDNLAVPGGQGRYVNRFRPEMFHVEQ